MSNAVALVVTLRTRVARPLASPAGLSVEQVRDELEVTSLLPHIPI